DRPSAVPDWTSCYVLMNVNRSLLTLSFRVVHMPCGAPAYTFRIAPFTSFDVGNADTGSGTIWSSSPWRISVGMSNLFRSSVRSVSENALMPKYEAGNPAIIACIQNDSRTPSETLAPGRL